MSNPRPKAPRLCFQKVIPPRVGDWKPRRSLNREVYPKIWRLKMTEMRRAALAVTFTFLIGMFCSAQAQSCPGTTYTDALQGSAGTSAVPFYNPLTGVTSYFGAVFVGSATGGIPGSFTLVVAFDPLTPPDGENGIGTGSIITPFSIFAISNKNGKPSSISGTIDSGTVEYKLNADGTATVINIMDAQVTIKGGKGIYRRVTSGCGTLDGGLDTSTGLFSGTLSLTF